MLTSTFKKVLELFVYMFAMDINLSRVPLVYNIFVLFSIRVIPVS